MKLQFYFFVLVFSFFLSCLLQSCLALRVSAEEKCADARSGPTQPLADLSLETCRQTRESASCRDVYSKIQADGGIWEEKALRCEVEEDLTLSDRIAVSYVSCLKGGVVGGIVTPFKSLGTWIGESTAQLVLNIQQNNERLLRCDQSSQIKKGLYSTYNSSVPQILHLDIPNDFSKKSCVQIEMDIRQQSNLKKKRAVLIDHKHFQVNPKLNPEEKEYLDWRYSGMSFGEKSEQSLVDLADKALEDYGVKVDCYNLAARVALRCEVLFALATFGWGGLNVAKVGVGALSGLKAERFFQSIQGLKIGALSVEESKNLVQIASRLNISRTVLKTRLIDKLSPSELRLLYDGLVKIDKGQFLSRDEALKVADMLYEANAKGILNFHLTQPGNLQSIKDQGKIYTSWFKLRVFAMPYRAKSGQYFSLGGGSKGFGEGEVIFQGEAAKLFSDYKGFGVISDLHKKGGHQVTKPGVLVIEEGGSEMVDGALVITKAHIQPLKGVAKLKPLAGISVNGISTLVWVVLDSALIDHSLSNIRE